jgi:hypothetical protein
MTIKRHPWRLMALEGTMRSFLKGMITGAMGVLVIVLVISALRFFHERDRKIFEYMERENEIQEIRDDIIGRDAYEFLDIPGVRGAADRANEEFIRKRDEAIQRIRSRHVD